MGNKRQVSFTNLPYGNYVLRVRGSNGDGFWNEIPTELKITITPPWYWSWPTKILYGLILGAVLYGIYRFQLKRRLAEAENLRLRELDDVKTRLYTNITHEFRTPLTVILGMVKNIRTDTQRWLEEGLHMIHRNGQNLLRLVNQMLDLSKLESGAMPVHLIQGDIIAYLKYLTESFHSFAESREVSLHFISDHEELVMDYDPDKTLNIVSNLLSNALKFTPAGGSVYLQIGKQENSDLPIQVRDTGAGIPEEKLPYIFDRFYQADDSATRQGEGTGIGLALTRELVKLLDGRIEVKSRVGQGSVFMVWLPVRHEAPLSGEMPEVEVNLSDTPAGVGQKMDLVHTGQDEDRPLALIVEDNEDVVRYLSGCLEGHYRLAVARDGQEGFEKAEELVPDIVVSDVMMPRKDGFELCDTLKHNRLTSHIPVVLLTAKADAASRISGLRRGADAYLAKPFDEEELLVILEKQLELRKTLQARYSSIEFAAKKDWKPAEPATLLEDEFILRIRSIIERRLEDYDLDVPQLCQEMATSRTQLHNKLKALTGKSATEYIRWIRLVKARELLLTTDLNISEIAYQCGFQLPHYFTRVFKEMEGCSPRDFREKNR
ncbi:MAG: response regulator [Lewinellaceae bacterium]|nr:response regulator [Lewinellaceae bacterium]